MVKLTIVPFFLIITGVVSTSPTPAKVGVSLEKRFNVLTGQWESENIGNGQYILFNNLWGKDQPGTSGSQTTEALSYSGTTISWKTQYSWSGNPNDVKSYANVALLKGLGRQLSAIKTIPTTWRWTYSAAASDLVANVSYDLWLSNIPNGTAASTTSTYEIMIWLSNRRAGPAGSQVATANIGGQNWAVFKGRFQTWDVYSFVASSELTNYNADLKPFFTYLSSSHGVSLSQYLVALQAGTEPFQKSGTLTTTSYTAAVN
ncbi:Glycosyl hydrolase family 12, partial [Rhizoctonia solani]